MTPSESCSLSRFQAERLGRRPIPPESGTANYYCSSEIAGQFPLKLVRPQLFPLIEADQRAINNGLGLILANSIQETVEEVIAGHRSVNFALFVVLIQLREVDHLVTAVVARFTVDFEHDLFRLTHKKLKPARKSDQQSLWSAGAWYRFGSHLRRCGNNCKQAHSGPLSRMSLESEMTTKAVPSSRTPKAVAISNASATNQRPFRHIAPPKVVSAARGATFRRFAPSLPIRAATVASARIQPGALPES